MDATATQATSITTAVTCNGASGIITTFNAATASGGTSVFTVNNNGVQAGNGIIAKIIGYSGTYTTNGLPSVTVNSVAAGSFQLVVQNPHGSNALNGTLKIMFQLV